MTRPAFNPVKPRAVGTPKAAVCDLVAQAGGIDHVMVRLAIGKSDAYAYTDAQSPKEMKFAQVAQLTGPECTAGVEYLAELAGGVFVPMPDDSTPIGRLTAESVRSNGQAAAELIGALDDNKLSAAEAQAALPELQAALRAIALLYSTVADVASQGARPTDKA